MNYTVGTQKMNTYCEWRSKASNRMYILFHRKKYLLCLTRKILLVKNFFPWQETFSCARKFLPVRGNVSYYRIFFLWQEILFLWQRISSSDRKFLPVKGSFFLLRQQISSCDRKFLPETGNFFLWQEISSCDKKFLLVNWA